MPQLRKADPPQGQRALISYAWLGGRCRRCAEPLHERVARGDGLTGALFGAAALRFEGAGQLALSLTLISVFIALAVTDLENRLLPSAIVGPASLAGLGLALWGGPAAWWTYPPAGLAAAGFLFALATVYPGGMGMGDVKMGGMLGLFLGPYVAMAVFLGALSGTIAYAALVATNRLKSITALPFGTFMAFGGLVALFVGPRLLALYLNLVGAG